MNCLIVRLAAYVLYPLATAVYALILTLGKTAAHAAVFSAAVFVAVLAIPIVLGAHARRTGERVISRLVKILALPLIIVAGLALGHSKGGPPPTGMVLPRNHDGSAALYTTSEKFGFVLLGLSAASFLLAWRFTGKEHDQIY